jgi:uncharacterized membrane protein
MASRNPWQALSLALLLALIAWEAWVAPLRPGGSWLTIKALPLLLPLFGMLHNRRRAFQGLALLIWLYALEGSMRLFSDSPGLRWTAGIELALALMLFVAVLLHLRRPT